VKGNHVLFETKLRAAIFCDETSHTEVPPHDFGKEQRPRQRNRNRAGDFWRVIDIVGKTVSLIADYKTYLAFALRSNPEKKTSQYNGIVAAIIENHGSINSSVLTSSVRRGGMGFEANYLAWMAQDEVIALDGATGKDSPIRVSRQDGAADG
jgi:hypothetical protein